MGNIGGIIAILLMPVGIYLCVKVLGDRKFWKGGTDETLWHKCNPFPARKTIDGKLTLMPGQVWRRRKPDGKWEYKQDPETDDDLLERQW